MLDYLSKNLDVDVFLEVPPRPPKKFVTIEKTGSGRRNYIDSATIAFQSWSATSKYEAAELNDKVKQVIFDSIKEPNISRAELNSDYDYTDTSTKKYRYQAVFDITYFD